jgi:hypothetical protein
MRKYLAPFALEGAKIFEVSVPGWIALEEGGDPRRIVVGIK